jgi:hypothetical protein
MTERTDTFNAYPIRDFREGEGFRVSPADSTTVNVWGHCANFCGDDRPQTDGLSVTEHGPWCESVFGAAADGHDADGREASLYGTLAQPYMHGVYSPDDAYRRRETTVRLLLVGRGVEPDADSEGKRVHLTPGEARRLAAGLVSLADQADGLHRDLRASTKQRRRSN